MRLADEPESGRVPSGQAWPNIPMASTPGRPQWITYRSTAEALTRERYLYLARAGPYLGEDRPRQLAERIEGLVSQEHAKWTASHQQATSPSEGR
jgi:hypothetical protein